MLSVRLDEELVGVEALAGLGGIGSMDAIAVQQSRPCFRQIAMPSLVCALSHLDALYLVASRGIEQAQLDLLSVSRE
jgi:hypothetical protein